MKKVNIQKDLDSRARIEGGAPYIEQELPFPPKPEPVKEEVTDDPPEATPDQEAHEEVPAAQAPKRGRKAQGDVQEV